MIITCPNCQTKYQVTYEAIGSAGRKVQCANCQQAWQQGPAAVVAAAADPQSDKLFENLSEDALDEVLQSEERAVAAEAAGGEDAARARRLAAAERQAKAADADEQQKRQKAFSRRQTAMISSLPMARLRRTARWVAALVLVAILGGAYFGRVQIVERYPAFAGLYESIGLGVNVVGLDLSNLETLRMLTEGKEVLIVSAQIVGLMPDPEPVPPIVVSLLDDRGVVVYEWSVAPRVHDLMVGERATFETRLSLPPTEAKRVRLSFASGAATPASGGQVPATGEEHVAAAPATATSEPHAAETLPAAHAEPAENHH